MERELGSYAMLPRGQEANIAPLATYYGLLRPATPQTTKYGPLFSKLITVTI